MQPNDPYNQQPVGIDYLNQIATPQPQAGFDKKSKIIMIIAGTVGILSLIFIALTALNQSNTGPSPVALSAKFQMLSKLSTKYGPKLRTSNFQDTNSSLGALLTTANQSINQPLQDYGIDMKKQANVIAQLSNTSEIEKTLDDAHLNATLDEAYSREMTYQIEDTLVMMRRIERTTRVQSMKDFLETTIVDFENIQKRLSDTSA